MNTKNSGLSLLASIVVICFMNSGDMVEDFFYYLWDSDKFGIVAIMVKALFLYAFAFFILKAGYDLIVLGGKNNSDDSERGG